MPKDKHLSENISYLCGKDFILMRKKELYDKVIAYFEQAMPVAETELNYGNPFELLIAVILSAQCTDKRVNLITPPLPRLSYTRSFSIQHSGSHLRIHP